MKTNALDFIAHLGKASVLAIAVVLFGAMSTARAQTDISNLHDSSVLRGLFTPTAAQRFFEAGRKEIEREAEILGNSELYFSGDILQIDPEIMEQIKEVQPQSEVRS